MAKVTAPLLSYNAGGAIAKTQVYAKWKGIPYARRYVIPANPQSTAQQQTRNVFTTLTQIWKNFTSDLSAPWVAFATGKALTDRNAFLKFNVAALRAGTDWTGYIGSPSANGGVALVSAPATGGVGTIDVTATAPTPPTGWTLSKVVSFARKNDDPHTTTDMSVLVASDSTAPYAPAFTGVAAGNYVVSTWAVWTKDDGKLAYGQSIESTATVT